MAIFRSRLPSKQDIALTFAVCAFPVHVWAIINLFREIPAWMLRLSLWELTGVIAYTLVFALVESVILLFALLVLSALLPARFLRDRFVSLGTGIVFLTSIWAVVAHYNDEAIRLWGLGRFLIAAALYLLSIVGVSVLIAHFQRIGVVMVSFAERLAIVSFVYISIDVLAVMVIIARNVGASI